MGSSHLKSGKTADEQMVTVTTTALKERLNRLYQGRKDKQSRNSLSSFNSFEHLWDLKELALLEGKGSLEVPRTWMDELETVLNTSEPRLN